MKSPCTKICTLRDEVCIGCGRTLKEIANWSKYTTEEMRQQSEVMDKTRGINKIRSEKGEDLYEFDYVLLCNKICGASHYSMQMKIIVEEEEAYNKWLAEQPTYAEKL